MRSAPSVVGRHAVPAARAVAALVLALGVAAGLVRVLPWLVAPRVPLAVALPFARGLAAVALETALLAAPPIGWALGAALAVERGEARALLALGASPARLVAGSVGGLVGFASLAALAAALWGRDASAPGRMARDLLAASRSACAEADAPTAVDVPLVRASWACFPGDAPRVVTELPGGGGVLSAASLAPSDDLRAIDASDLYALVGSDGALRLHVREARVRGLSPWTRASNLAPALRAGLLALTAGIGALLAAWIVVRTSVASRTRSLVLGASGPVAALAVLSSLERAPTPPLAYVAVPAACVAAALGLAALLAFADRARGRAVR